MVYVISQNSTTSLYYKQNIKTKEITAGNKKFDNPGKIQRYTQKIQGSGCEYIYALHFLCILMILVISETNIVS